MNDLSDPICLVGDNGFGQGYSPRHHEHRFHTVLSEHDWCYSHSTRITRVDGTKYLLHTYKYAKDTNIVIGITVPGGIRPVLIHWCRLGQARKYSIDPSELRSKLVKFDKQFKSSGPKPKKGQNAPG